MDTHNEKPKSTQRIPTEIEYHEKGQWAKGERIITVVGGLPGEAKRPIGYITLIDYDENKKPILAATDLDGNEWCERSGNLYQLKKQFREHEARLTKALLIKEHSSKQEVTPDVSQEPKANELATTRKRKAAVNTHTR